MTLKGPINTFILVANRNKQKQLLNSFKHSGLFEYFFNFLNPNATRTNPDTYHNIYESFGNQKKCDLQPIFKPYGYQQPCKCSDPEWGYGLSIIKQYEQKAH